MKRQILGLILASIVISGTLYQAHSQNSGCSQTMTISYNYWPSWTGLAPCQGTDPCSYDEYAYPCDACWSNVPWYYPNTSCEVDGNCENSYQDYENGTCNISGPSSYGYCTDGDPSGDPIGCSCDVTCDSQCAM
jgi:hypothetical protein